MKRMTHNDVIDIIDNAGKETAEKWISNHPEIEAANKLARIEKAAPDLLEALKLIEKAFTDGDIKFTKKRQADSDPYHPANIKMCAAIAAAEGGE
uniref:Uncharacterized protein n=1 Tax=viral metagenome TaxID=1070528 RepID=A0A6M3LCG8_9ZZZZ